MYLISEEVAASVVSLESVIPLMEDAFKLLEGGKVELLPVVIGKGFGEGSSFGAKGGLIRGMDVFGFKFGSYWPDNKKKGLKAHGSTTVLLDPATSFPMALIGAKHLSAVRSAALDAAAIRALSREESTTLGVVGSGYQAWWEFLAALSVRPISRVLVWGRTAESARRFAMRVTAEHNIRAEAVELRDAVYNADIVVTATASTAPLVERGWVRPGTHISAMGADARGKQELFVDLVGCARLFTDIVEQSVTIGEFKTAYGEGIISRDSITPIGAVLGGPSRREPSDVTIFDSSGTALQDLVIGKFVLDAAVERNLAIAVNENL